MVEVDTIEKLNEQLLEKARDCVTVKSDQEIQDIMELLNSTKYSKNDTALEMKGSETQRQYCLHLVEQLSDTLSYLKAGVLYRNKRVFNKLKLVSLR